jgi:diamine N-acetyltransferase
MDIGIQIATKDDIAAIQEIANKAWPVAFKDILSPQQIQYMLNCMYSTPALMEQFEEGVIFLIASNLGSKLGFAGFQLDYPEKSLCKLHKLYLLPDMKGQGIGKLLINNIISECSNKNQNSLILNVNRQNSAVKFYKMLGFKIIKEEDNPIGNGYFMNDYVMELQLSY